MIKFEYIKNPSIFRGVLFWWIIAIILTFSSTKYLPGMMIFSDAWAVVSLCMLLFLVFFSEYEFSLFEKYLVAMAFYLPFSSAICSFLVFDQPLLYGILCERQLFIVGFTLFFLRLVRQERVGIDILCKAFETLSWVNLGLTVFANLLIDPTKLAPADGFVDESDPRLMLESSFIVFGFLFYGISGFVRGVNRHIFYSLIFIAGYAIYSGGRFGLISMVVAFVICCAKWLSIRDASVFLIKVSIALVVGSGIALAVDQEKIDSLIYKFGEAFFVLTTGQESFDDSANSRLTQLDIIMPYLEDNFIFGNGFLSAQWNEGFKGFFGYFHPSDNGYLGVVFVYGVLGLFLVLLQFYFAYKISCRIKKIKNVGAVDFLRAVQAFLVFIFIYSFTTGRMAFNFEHTVFMVSILYAYCFFYDESGFGLRRK